MKFRIIEAIIKDKLDEITNTTYHVEQLKSFLGIKYWSRCGEPDYCGGGATLHSPFSFESKQEAQQFIDNRLKTNKPYKYYSETVVS